MKENRYYHTKQRKREREKKKLLKNRKTNQKMCDEREKGEREGKKEGWGGKGSK